MPIGSLIVKIGADISGIRRDSARGAQSLKSVERGAKSLGFALKALAFGFVARQMTRMVQDSLQVIDSQAKLARQIGGTINGLQGLQLAADEAGVSAGALTKGAEMLNRRLGEAARKGAGEAHEALVQLGLDARELSAMDVDVRMATLSDAMIDAGMSTAAMADTLGMLGIRQGEFVRLITTGSEAILAGRTAIDRMGLSLSELDASQVEAANDAMGRVRLASTAISRHLAVALSPMLTVISNQFLDMAADSEGVRDSVRGVVEFGVKAFGFLGDAIKGIALVFKAVEVAGWVLASTIIEVVRSVNEIVATMVDDLITNQINSLIGALNKIPGVEITPLELAQDGSFTKALNKMAADVHVTTAAVAHQFAEMVTQEWPSSKAEAFFRKVQEAAIAAGNEVIKQRREMLSLGGGGEGADEQQQKEVDQLRKKLEDRLNILREFAMTEDELKNARRERNLQLLNEALDAELLTLVEFARISEGIESKHMRSMASIRKKGMDRVQDISVMSMATGVKQITGMLSGLTATMARENKTMFDVHKAFAIADALISGAMGVAQTMGAYMYPLNLIMAGAHAVMAAAQVGIIASQQFNSGGGRSVMTSETGAGVAAGAAAGATGGTGQGGGVSGGQTQTFSINLEGDTFSRNTILSLIESLNEAIGDGARIEVT